MTKTTSTITCDQCGKEHPTTLYCLGNRTIITLVPSERLKQSLPKECHSYGWDVCDLGCLRLLLDRLEAQVASKPQIDA